MAERDNRRDDRGSRRGGDDNPEFADRLVAINRVSKTVKGGKRFGFAALVVVGDQRGRVGFGKGKAKEVPEAIRKATEQAKRSLIRVPLREGRTLHHDIEGRHGAGKVVMRTAVRRHRHHRRWPDARRLRDAGPAGRGGQVARLGQNPYNMIRATIDGLKKGASPRMVAQRRGKKVAEVLPQARNRGRGRSRWRPEMKRRRPREDWRRRPRSSSSRYASAARSPRSRPRR